LQVNTRFWDADIVEHPLRECCLLQSKQLSRLRPQFVTQLFFIVVPCLILTPRREVSLDARFLFYNTNMKSFSLVSLFAFSCLLCGCFQAAPPSVTPPAAETTVSAEDATPRETLNKTTQVVLEFDKAIADGGVVADTNIPVADPLTQSAAGYRTAVAKIGGMAVDQAIQLRNAQSINDPKPLTYEQFMTEIIRKDQPDGIQLAMLPYYQEYTWDVKSQKLVVVDFPARKEARQKQLDSN
jgi:hypothetical protein